MPDSAAQNQGPVNGRPYLIVLGNEKRRFWQINHRDAHRGCAFA